MTSTTWTKEIQLSAPAVYVVAQVKRGYYILVLDVNNDVNELLLKEAPVIIQMFWGDLLNPWMQY